MSKRVENLIERAVKELWGWSPNGISLTPQQQAGAVLSELRSLFRDYGVSVGSMTATVSKSTGELTIEVLVSGQLVTKRYDKTEQRRGQTMQSKSEHADQADDYDLALGGEGGGA